MTPRSLVGMTMGARKRRARAVTYVALNEVTFVEAAEALAAPIHCARFHARKFPRHEYDLQMYKFVRLRYRIGQRLRPCPGCAKCGSPVRRFVPVVGWCRPRDWVLWDGAKLWRGGRRWRRPCPITNLRDYSEAADRGTWKELFCDGSGVLPARAKKVRR